MAQNENYSQVDLRVGTEAQFNAKVDTLPAGTLFGVTDSTVSKADLSTDLKNEINGKYTKPSTGIPKTDLASAVQTSLGKADSAVQKPSTPTTESAITINSSGTISTKPLSSITGKTEVYVGSTTPTNPGEILWIDPNGTSGGGGSGGGKLYKHYITIKGNSFFIYFLIYTHSDESIDSISKINSITGSILYGAFNGQYGNGTVSFLLRQPSNDVIIYGCISPLSGNTQYVFVEGSNVYAVNNITDAVVEV